jgi:hypothetical protein
MDTKILIAVPTSEMARRADFYDYLNMIDKPIGTAYNAVHGSSPARNRNLMIELALAENYTHIFFLDDDCVCRPNVLHKLLAHDVDMVSGLYLKRNYPHLPIMFDHAFQDGRCRYTFLSDGRKGLIEVLAAGLGACLIKMNVFRTMDKPWITLGELEKDHWCDDISFFLRARDAGFKLHMDLDCPVGHIMTGIIWPDNVEGKWMTAYDTGAGQIFHVPQTVPSAQELQEALEKDGVVA